jgi:hypothetical protein
LSGVQSAKRTGASCTRLSGVEAGFQPGQVDEGLEGRAGLAQRLGHPVELAFAVVAPADHGAHGAVGREAHHRRLPGLPLVARLAQHRPQLLVGDPLQAGVDGGDDADIGVDAAEVVAHLGQNPVGEVRRDVVARDAGGRLLLQRGGGLRLGDEAGVHHGAQHQRRALVGAGGIARRIEARGRLQQARQQRGFVERHPGRRLAEVVARRRVHPVGTGAEVDAVEVDGEDLVLGEAPLQPERQHDFLNLAPDGALGGEEEILGELLGEGRATLGDASLANVHVDRAQEPAIVDAAVIVEAAVLHGDHRARQLRRQFLQAVGGAETVAEGGETGAVGGQQGDVGPPRQLLDLAEFRQVVGVPGDHPGHGDAAPDDGDQRPGRRAAQQAGRPADARLSAAALLRLAGYGGLAAAGGAAGRSRSAPGAVPTLLPHGL